MERRGVILVESTHDLHPSNRCEAVKSRALEVINSIRNDLKLAEKELSFQIRSHARSQRSGVKVLRSIYDGSSDADQVRVVFCDEPLHDAFVRSFFPGNKLIIAIEESTHSQGIYSSGSSNGCKIRVGPRKASRIIEDVFIDIFIGRWMANTPVLEGLIKQHGHDALYKAKARYFQSNARKSWMSLINKEAGYAPLSALNDVDDDDIKGRAQQTIFQWATFVDSLTAKSLGSGAGVSIKPTNSSIEKLPKLGGQLPARSIRRTASKLPDGLYLIAILRKSSTARKNPKTKNRILSIFGKNARVNSFRILSATDFSSQKNVVEDLIRSRFAVGLNIEITNGIPTISGILEGD